MKYISLFAGVGGFDLALNRLGHECVYANDFDKYCKIIYDKNFASEIHKGNGESPQGNGETGSLKQGLETKGQDLRSIGNSANPDESRDAGKVSHYDYKRYGLDTRSITGVSASEIPNHDLLVGGFPCQSFSIAGKRGGFDDTRGTLFFDVARIVKAKRPKYILLENVKGLLSHDSGRTFKTILSTLTELQYDIQTMVLNSKNFGVPQNRERVFIVGHLRGEPRPKVFPLGNNSQADIVIPTLTARYWGGQANGGYIGNKEINGSENPVVPTIRATQHKSGDNQTLVKKLNMKIRRLTPTECERLQGFPDGWTEGVSDTQRYKMMGNAVTVNVVQAVASRFNI